MKHDIALPDGQRMGPKSFSSSRQHCFGRGYQGHFISSLIGATEAIFQKRQGSLLRHLGYAPSVGCDIFLFRFSLAKEPNAQDKEINLSIYQRYFACSSAHSKTCSGYFVATRIKTFALGGG